ncbi:hypothetical protein JAU75_10895 [Ochrobactrum sp. Q0168]|uniref:hypothetical protein n=1 Tax=Ochrobactrum sp. Q0168 TaxID=2793241 RepID=UPI0018EBD627|nr:hypothetical protein [Ochrobactrum sp. Q0168]
MLIGCILAWPIPAYPVCATLFLSSAYMNAIFREGSTFDFPNARVNPKIVALKKKKIESLAKNCEGLWIIYRLDADDRRRAEQ